jgi:hypothetical protein
MKMTARNKCSKEEPLHTLSLFVAPPDFLLLELLLPEEVASRPANIPVTALCCWVVTPISAADVQRLI